MRCLSLFICLIVQVSIKPLLANPSLEQCHKEINTLAEEGKDLASEKGLKGLIDKAQIGSIRALGDKSTLDACTKTRNKLSKIIDTIKPQTLPSSSN